MNPNFDRFIAAQQQAVNGGQVMMVILPLVMLAIILALIAVAVYTVKKGRMPHALEVLRDARQPIRNHRHYHYSARASMQPLNSEEAEQYDVTSLND